MIECPICIEIISEESQDLGFDQTVLQYSNGGSFEFAYK